MGIEGNQWYRPVLYLRWEDNEGGRLFDQVIRDMNDKFVNPLAQKEQNLIWKDSNMTATDEYDVFISHASEDKEDFVKPLAEELRKRGYRVWYDEFSLSWGDSLSRSIDKGISQSKFGIIVFSRNFFNKKWTERELNGFVSKEAPDRKVILPIWHKVSKDEVSENYPILADKLAINSSKGNNYIISKFSELVEEKKIKSLLERLTDSQENLICIKRAYQACSPEGWLYPKTDTLAGILADLKKMPQGSSEYRIIQRFVACLVADSEIPPLVSQPLKEWAEQNISEFSELLNQEKQNLEEKRKNTNSYLLVVLNCSEQKSALSHTSDYYTVKAWIIPDIQTYDYKSGVGCEQLTLPEFSDKTFPIDEIPRVLKNFLDESSQYSYRNLTIEIFLPLGLLNHAVDGWELEDDLDLGFSPPIIGQDYRVVVRSYERLTDVYKRRRVFWEHKWETLQQFTHPCACSAFLLGDDETVKDLIPKLKSPEIIGLKVAKAPEKIGKGSIFAAILETAIPVALWLRQSLPGLDCQSEIEQILSCCIHHLPEAVKQKRQPPTPNTDTHIGHHLSLLWEDPYRLPPSIDYSM